MSFDWSACTPSHAAMAVTGIVLGVVSTQYYTRYQRNRQPPAKRKDKGGNADWDLYREVLFKDNKRYSLCHLPPTSCEQILKYDPRNCDALTAFSPIQSQTKCLFAKRARLWGSPTYNTNKTIEENVQECVPSFSLFAAQTEGIDGYLVDIAVPGIGETVSDFARVMKTVLTVLSENDPSGSHCMGKSYVGKRGWVYSFGRLELFVTAFASCYQDDNSRYTYGVRDHVFILFQPYHSFLYHDVGSDIPAKFTNWDAPKTVRDRIRVRFKDAGQEYFIPENPQTYPVGLQFVPPLHLDGEPVEWWKDQE